MKPQIFLIEMAQAKKWSLIVLTPPSIIGRNTSCDVVVDDASVEAEHVKIVWQDEEPVCTTMATSQGTCINGTSIRCELLHDGDLLSLGAVPFLVKIAQTALPRLYLPKEDRTIAIGMYPFYIGRGEASHLALSDTTVSTRHATIQKENDNYFLEDCHSRNGTTINGERIERAALHDGDMLELGKWKAVFLQALMPSDGYCLRFLSGERYGETVAVTSKFKIGRTPDNDLVITDTVISSHHALLTWRNHQFWLKDLQSMNGTKVRGCRIQEEFPVKHGDEILFAKYSLLFYSGECPAEKFYLVFGEGEKGGEEIELTAERFLIGRGASCQLQLHGQEVSANHAEILPQGGTFVIHDLHSTNGTWVNGNKVESAILRHGDQIALGTHRLVFRSSVQARPEALQEEKFVLLPLYHGSYGQPIPVTTKCTMGSAVDNNVVVSEAEAHHAEIFYDKAQYYLKDCGSAEGTRLNGSKITTEPLAHGDEIKIGKSRYLFKNNLRPVFKRHAVPRRKSVAGMAVTCTVATILMALSLFLFFSVNHTAPPEQTATPSEKKDPPRPKEDDWMAECWQKAWLAQKQYAYAEAIDVLKVCHRKLALPQHRQDVIREIAEVEAESQFFDEWRGRLRLKTPTVALQLPQRGSCSLERVTFESIICQPQDSILDSIEFRWKDIPPKFIAPLIDATGLGEEKPYETAQFLFLHGEKNTIEKYLVNAWAKYPQLHPNIEKLYEEAFHTTVPPGGLVVHQGKFISASQKEKLVEEEKRRAEQLQAEVAEQEAEKQKQEQENLLKILRAREREEFPMRVSLIEKFVRTYSYQKALDSLRGLATELSAADLRQKVEERIAEVEPLARLFDRMLQAINLSTLRDNRIQLSETISGRLVKADQERFHIIFSRGLLKQKWYQLPPEKLYQFYNRLTLAPEDLFLLGVFCLDNEMQAEGNRALVEFLQKEPQQQTKVDNYLAKKLGIPVPEGGFVPYQGTLITRDERQKRLDGFVRYKGNWVSKEEKERFEAGLVKYKDKWVTPDEKEMLAKGYTKHQDKWYSRDELKQLRTQWEYAWTLETDHYNIKSNVSEEFITELGSFLEGACAEYQKFFDKAVDNKMNVYAFRSYEDYRSHCLSTKNESELRAFGFATNKGNLAVGYLRDTPKSLFETMAHEGAHLYHYNACPTCHPLPSFFAEAMATQFEGYNWDGKNFKVDFLAKNRLRWLQRCFLRNQYIPLKELFQSDAGDLINRNPENAVHFYAESWGLYYFLSRSPVYQKQFNGLIQKINSGSLRGKELQAFFEEFGQNINEIESTWRKYILAMD